MADSIQILVNGQQHDIDFWKLCDASVIDHKEKMVRFSLIPHYHFMVNGDVKDTDVGHHKCNATEYQAYCMESLQILLPMCHPMLKCGPGHTAYHVNKS